MTRYLLKQLDWASDLTEHTAAAIGSDVAGAAFDVLLSGPPLEDHVSVAVTIDEIVGCNGWPVVTLTFTSRAAAETFARAYFEGCDDKEVQEFIIEEETT